MYSCTLASVLLYRCDTEVARRFFGFTGVGTQTLWEQFFFFRPRGLLLRATVLRDELERPAAFSRRCFWSRSEDD